MDRDINAFLQREDKWYLGGGDRLVWTPGHPIWLDTLGFWDEAHYFHLEVAPLFTITLLDEDGRVVPYRREDRSWQPDGLRQRYSTSEDLGLTEVKSMLPGDVLASELTLNNTGDTPRTLHLLCWTVQDTCPSEERHYITDPVFRDDRLHFTRHTQPDRQPLQTFGAALGFDRPVASHALQLSQTGPLQPHWSLTPFYESFQGGKLDEATRLGGTDADGRLYFALHTELNLAPGEETSVTCGFAAAEDAATASSQLDHALEYDKPVHQSIEHWNDYFGSLPDFACSDPYLDAYYWYRWYGLHLFTTRAREGTYRHPAVYEGPGYFRKLITYSAQCHMLETRWMASPEVAQGSLLNFIENQREDGSFSGHLFPYWDQAESFYHVNWSHACDIHFVHSDDEFLRTSYEALVRYVEYFDRERDPENSGLYDILNHYETGQEYMHRYVAVSDAADKVHWGSQFRLKGVDVAVQMYCIKKMLAQLAARFGNAEDATRWARSAEQTRQAVRDQMWDPDEEMFFDVDPQTGERTGVKATTCFYPYFTDLVDEGHLSGFRRHLFSPNEFWTPHPVPSSSRDDDYFSAEPLWKGKRMNCPWNGRVWPMTNSHVAEAIAQSAIRFDDNELRERAADFITRFVRLLFFDDDPSRPNCFEHYNPVTGQACRYRGVDDYQHSWVVDLLIKYLCGIRPDADSVTVDPFPFDVEHVEIDRVPVRGHLLRVVRDGDRFDVSIDGESAGTSRLGEPMRLDV